MSLLCESQAQIQPNCLNNVDDFSSLIFSYILESKDGVKLEKNEYALHLPGIDNKLTNGITTWFCSHQLNDFTIKVALEIKNVKKNIEKRLPDILNKEFKLVRIIYQKPKITFMFKLSMPSKPSSSTILLKEINQIISTITQVMNRIKELDKQQEKFQPFYDLYSMRECFQFARSSRPKASKISLKSKGNKNVTQVLKLLSLGQISLNRLQSVYIEGQIKKYEEQKKKINSTLEQSSKIKDKAVDQSILTSIDIIHVKDQRAVTFSNQNIEDLLSVISTALYTFRKQITIHKESKLQSLSNQIFTQILVKKQKTSKGASSFQNQTKFLTHIKGSYHPYIAQYFCKLQEWPFKSEALYVKFYKTSFNSVKQNLSSDKKLRILYQISKVITFLNYRKICHRDLKLDNIMIDEEMNPKIIDWGSVCGMYSIENDPGALKVKDQRLFATQGYFQRYYEEVFHEPFGKHYTKQEIEKGQYFDIYSFGNIIDKIFDLQNSDLGYWLELEMDYLSKKCREKNPSDRLNAIELQIYLTLLRKKMKKFQQNGLSSPLSSNS